MSMDIFAVPLAEGLETAAAGFMSWASRVNNLSVVDRPVPGRRREETIRATSGWLGQKGGKSRDRNDKSVHGAYLSSCPVSVSVFCSGRYFCSAA